MIKFSLPNKILLGGIAISVMALSGCSVNRMSAMQRNFHEEASLQNDFPSKTFSDAQQFIYSLERVKPVGVNDLDSFNAFKSVTTDNFAANAVGASLAIPASPWLALNNFIVSQSRNGTPLLRENVLVLMSPILSDKDTPKDILNNEIEEVIDRLTERGANMILDAYKKEGTPVNITEPDTNRRTGYASWFNPMIYVPDGVEYCPNGVKSVSELSDQQLKYCTTVVSNRGFVNFSNPKSKSAVPFTVDGNYAYKLIRLPDGFPVESLSTNQDNAFLFMPSFIYRKSDILADIDQQTISKLAKEGRITLNPLLKNIHTNQYFYFNSEIAKYQTSMLERVNEEVVFEKMNQ